MVCPKNILFLKFNLKWQKRSNRLPPVFWWRRFILRYLYITLSIDGVTGDVMSMPGGVRTHHGNFYCSLPSDMCAHHGLFRARAFETHAPFHTYSSKSHWTGQWFIQAKSESSLAFVDVTRSDSDHIYYIPVHVIYRLYVNMCMHFVTVYIRFSCFLNF